MTQKTLERKSQIRARISTRLKELSFKDLCSVGVHFQITEYWLVRKRDKRILDGPFHTYIQADNAAKLRYSKKVRVKVLSIAEIANWPE